MNYVIVVVAIVTIMCAATWLIDGRKHFLGPQHIVIYSDLPDKKGSAFGESHELVSDS